MSFDSYRAFAMADPDLHPSFRRRWTDRPFTPAEMDRLADFELQHGRFGRAEQLSHRAAAMREDGR